MKYAKYAMVQSFHGVIFAYQMNKEFFFLDDQPEEKHGCSSMADSYVTGKNESGGCVRMIM